MPDTPYYVALGRTIKRAFFVITIIFFLILAGFAWVVHDIRELSQRTNNLSIENTKRINEIQTNRIGSCESTYTGIYDVFVEFFPDHPRSKEEQESVDKFTNKIEVLRDDCAKQTSIEGE